MRKTTVTLTIFSVLFVIGSFGQAIARTWNNPESKWRYQRIQREAMQAYRNESRAWSNYDRELSRAQNDVRSVRDEAYKGAAKGGAAGAAWGAAKGATKSLYYRGRDSYRNYRERGYRNR